MFHNANEVKLGNRKEFQFHLKLELFWILLSMIYCSRLSLQNATR